MSTPEVPTPAGVVRYLLPGDWRVFAGKTDAANEELSLRFARPRDLWFHIHGPVSYTHLTLPTNREV